MHELLPLSPVEQKVVDAARDGEVAETIRPGMGLSPASSTGDRGAAAVVVSGSRVCHPPRIAVEKWVRMSRAVAAEEI
jgi:hypothetical protein